jgi:pimeloyl-ACP methyl ester carboxylesterase
MHPARYAMRMPMPLAAGLLAVAAAGTATAAPPAAVAARASRPAPATPAVPALHWQPCDGSFQCATARVPLDYRHPRGQLISIAVIRHPATDPARRAGTLFFNPGGPGTSGTALAPVGYRLFPAQVRARFDIVSFDPRGVPASTAIRCFPDATAENRFLSRAPQGFPVGARQEVAWVRTYAAFEERCVRRGGSLLTHDSAADVARDMDLLRQAVGAPKLNYLGISWGTLLGATYANLFPGKVGAMILDGNIDPVAWTQPSGDLPTALRMGTDMSSAATLHAFLDLCGAAGASRCAFSAGSPAATRAKFAALLGRLRRHPVAIGSPPQLYTYASTVQAAANFLDTTQPEPALGFPGWTGGASLLQQLWQAPPAHGGQAAAVAPSSPYNGLEQEMAVMCGESPNPRDPRAYDGLARLAYRRSGPVGPYWSWLTEVCSRWPATADPYRGPWDRRTASPILVIGNTVDPNTPYQDALAMSRDLARGRLLTVHGYGHTEFLNPSSCAARYETRYLLTGALPPAGTICRQDKAPFGAWRN